MDREFHHLTVAALRREIDGRATSVSFDVPRDLFDSYRWQAGQHLTLRLLLAGQEERRSYTISTPPGTPMRITVKRVHKGKVSNHLCDGLQVGDRLEVMPPFGSFALTPGALARRTHWFFGAGSGITPLFAMINTVLSEEPHSVAHLVYGNADEGTILFKDELEALETAHPDRFTLRHILSAPSIWSWFTPWCKGRVDAEAIQTALGETPPVAQDVHYWICGPGSMNADVKAALMALDVPANRIHSESFGGADALDTSVEGLAAQAQIRLSGKTHEVPVAQGQTLLEAARAAGLTPPFSCQSGVCGACKAQVRKGKVHMRASMALEQEEIAKGVVLSCQSVASSPTVTLDFD